MNVLDLLARLGGEILSNKARAVVDGKIVILARMNGDEWVYTAEGQELANAHSNAVVEEAEAKPKRSKKAPEPVVEAEATPEAVAAVESANVEPEL
jgi:protein required for attachment to host cells